MISERLDQKSEVRLIEGNKALDLVKDEINRILLSSPVIIRQYTSHLVASSGKFIRAESLLTCALNKDGLVHYNAIKFAAAIELLHLATLIHDDIIDDADIRRGKISLQKKFGKRTAVICGDYLMSIALKTATDITNTEDYLKMGAPNYMAKICLGELNQHLNNGNLDLSVRQYFKIISGKTAALFEASFYAGAILSESDNKNIKQYQRLGRYIGMIFQMTDDCLDFEATTARAKKPVQSDFEQGVITLPIIYAFKKITGFKEKAQNGQVTRNDINKAVEKVGGLSYTRFVSKKYYDKALIIINELDISPDKRAKLICILDKAYRT